MKGQIIKILSNLYTINSNGKLYECHARGKFRNQNISPVVGDYCIFDEKNNYILEILPRKNYLIRPLVSNIDQGIIITSVKHPDFSSNLLDKLITIMEFNKIEPIICFTKWDLLDLDESKEMEQLVKYYKKIGYTTLKSTDLKTLEKILAGKTSVFTGQTGAGKSTLMNNLDSSLNLATGEISEALGRGRHTTRHVELIEMFNGKVLDTPGFSSIDFNSMTIEDVKECFIEFSNYPCPFRDCMHINEKDCNVKKNVTSGNILNSRYENYKKIVESIK